MMTDIVPLINEDGSFKNQKTNKAIDSRIGSFLNDSKNSQNELNVGVDGKFTINTDYDLNIIDNSEYNAVMPTINGDGLSTVLYFKNGYYLRNLSWEGGIVHHGYAPISSSNPVLATLVKIGSDYHVIWPNTGGGGGSAEGGVSITEVTLEQLKNGTTEVPPWGYAKLSVEEDPTEEIRFINATGNPARQNILLSDGEYSQYVVINSSESWRDSRFAIECRNIYYGISGKQSGQFMIDYRDMPKKNPGDWNADYIVPEDGGGWELFTYKYPGEGVSYSVGSSISSALENSGLREVTYNYNQESGEEEYTVYLRYHHENPNFSRFARQGYTYISGGYLEELDPVKYLRVGFEYKDLYTSDGSFQDATGITPTMKVLTKAEMDEAVGHEMEWSPEDDTTSNDA